MSKVLSSREMRRPDPIPTAAAEIKMYMPCTSSPIIPILVEVISFDFGFSSPERTCLFVFFPFVQSGGGGERSKNLAIPPFWGPLVPRQKSVQPFRGRLILPDFANCIKITGKNQSKIGSGGRQAGRPLIHQWARV